MGDPEPLASRPAADRRTPHPAPSAADPATFVDASIVIIAARRTAYLDEALAAITRLKRPPAETIVVLDEAPAASLGAARCIVSGPTGPAQKRDMGASAASGALVAFLDDDAYPAPGWLEAAVPHFQNPTVWAVGGPGVTPPGDAFRAQASGWTYASWIVSGPTRFRYVPGPRRAVDDYPSMNLIVRRSAFETVGGFDSAFYPGEDTKLCLELVRRGGGIVYEPGALVYHHRRPVMRGHLRQIAQYGRHRGYFARVFPETSRRFQYFIPSAWLVWLVAGALASVWLEPVRAVFLGTLAFYGIAVGGSAVLAAWSSRSVGIGAVVLPAIVASHLWYGWHFVGGLVRPRPPSS